MLKYDQSQWWDILSLTTNKDEVALSELEYKYKYDFVEIHDASTRVNT